MSKKFEAVSSKKCNKKDISTSQNPELISNPVSLNLKIDYQKFLIRKTDQAILESEKTSLYLDSLIANLEKEYEMHRNENQKLSQNINENIAQFKKWEEEKKTQQDLLERLRPKIIELEKNKQNALRSKQQFLQLSNTVKKLKEEKSQEQTYANLAKMQVEKKKAELDELQKTIHKQEIQRQRVQNLLNNTDVQNQELFNLKKKLNNQLQELKGNIRVYCRVRPSKQQQSTITVTSDNTLKIFNQKQKGKEEKGYIFEQIFGQDQTQQHVFNQMSQLVQNAIDGKNVCIFAYGQTGSGKTYTLLGPEETNMSEIQKSNHKGLAPRSFQLIFKHIENNRKFRWNTRAFLSIQELYLDNMIDLISKNQNVRQTCTEVEVTQERQIMLYLNEAILNRKKAATNVNERSSRSHLIISLRLQAFSEKSDEKREGSLVFIDLAGSERLKQSKVEGELLKQTQFINKSLSALGVVINQMRKNSEHISFRSSKLTRALQKYLQGKSKTLMFVNISPDIEDLSQTKISLGFAQNVSQCRLKK